MKMTDNVCGFKMMYSRHFKEHCLQASSGTPQFVRNNKKCLKGIDYRRFQQGG
jgi:hypothetical protein